MKPEKILITGATGFIGSRLCERLSLVHKFPYRALVRNFSRANRIARVEAEMVKGELLNRESVNQALQDCDVVMHLAHSEDRLAPKETSILVDACIEAGIKRFIHVSSMAVYGPDAGPECAKESTASIRHYREAYSDSKAGQEKVIFNAIRKHNFPAVIVRPTVVYGPYSGFVTSVLDAAGAGELTLIDRGKGICNAVYVDDVCDAIVAAMLADDVVGEAFNINADDATDWESFNLKFARLKNKDIELTEVRSEDALAHWASVRPRFRDNFKQLAGLMASNDFHAMLSRVPLFGSILQWAKRTLAGQLSEKQKLKLKLKLGRRYNPEPLQGNSLEWPDPGRLVRECYKVEISNEKAKNELGWSPVYNFDSGVEVTATWLKFAKFTD